MTAIEAINMIGAEGYGTLAVIALIILSLIKIKPLETNILGYFVRWLGENFNHSMSNTLDVINSRQIEIEEKLVDHIDEDQVDTILAERKFVLRFAREILKGEKHTKEDFLECLQSIDKYEKYCADHPDFPNNRAVCAIKLIKDNYQERLEKADFLADGRRGE